MSTQSKCLYAFGPFKLDAHRRVLLRARKPVHVEPKVLDLLVVLVQNCGRVVNRDDLINQLWPDTFVEESNLTVNMAKLRDALGETPNEHRYVQTVPRRGYRFVACVTEELHRGKPAQTKVYPTNSNSKGRARRISIAVLAFKPIGEVSDACLCLGMAAASSTTLSKLKCVTVLPTNSICGYNGTDDAISAGRELGVQWVLDGNVARSGRLTRVTMELVNVRNGALLWAEKLDEEFTGAFDLQDSISERAERLCYAN